MTVQGTVINCLLGVQIIYKVVFYIFQVENSCSGVAESADISGALTVV
jgi:hypothetical protein